MAKDLLSHLAKQLYSVQGTGRSLLCNGLDVQRRVHRRVWNKDEDAGVKGSAGEETKAALQVQSKDLFVPGV